MPLCGDSCIEHPKTKFPPSQSCLTIQWFRKHDSNSLYNKIEELNFPTIFSHNLRNADFYQLYLLNDVWNPHKTNLLSQKTNILASNKHLLKAFHGPGAMVDTNLKVNLQVFIWRIYSYLKENLQSFKVKHQKRMSFPSKIYVYFNITKDQTIFYATQTHTHAHNIYTHEPHLHLKFLQ